MPKKKKKQLTPEEIEMKNQEKLIALLEVTSPQVLLENMPDSFFEELVKYKNEEYYWVLRALNQNPQVLPSVLVEFIFKLSEVIRDGYGTAWVEVQQGKPTFARIRKDFKFKQVAF